MNLYSLLFYILGIFVLALTLLAVTKKNLIHALLFLIASFLGTAMIFYLLGAPFLAVLEVIIYAGAIIVMFLFMLMTLKNKNREQKENRSYRESWAFAVFLGGASLVLLAVLLGAGTDHNFMLKPAMATPGALGKAVFSKFWLSIEVVSLLLFVALAGVLYLAQENGHRKKTEKPEKEVS